MAIDTTIKRDPDSIRARWQPILGLRAYLTGATAGRAMWGWARQADGSLLQGMPAAEQYAHPGNIGANFAFTRDGKPLEVSPNDLLAVLSAAADDVFTLLLENDQLRSALAYRDAGEPTNY